MNTYDFHTLNDKEFEALVVDLLSVEEAKRFERFKPGKDGGVDGRYYRTAGKETILQCKHWSGSGYPALVRQLTKVEQPKLSKLKPSRYIVVTSLSLSRENKTEIANIFSGYMRSESDVFGREDLNDLLLRHPDVERRHYKLWFASTTVLRNLLNAAIEGRSRAELEAIRDEAPIYVLTSDYPKARDHLKEHRIIILTGEPGVGKTTLARQMILEHAAAGYELIVIEESVSEAEAVFRDGGKQFFYFDDFLGRTFLEALKAREDSHIVRFLKRVSRDPAKRFVLTSRTNILNQGKSLTDAFAIGAVEQNQYEMRVGSLTTMDKARILYSHMWHSRLGGGCIDEMYQDRRYLKVIGHANFNPRLIAFILDDAKVGEIAPDRYWDYVARTLANPQDVWAHFFDNQMSQDARDLVFLTVLNGKRIAETDLREAFLLIHRNTASNIGLLDHRFRKACQHCAGSILDRVIRDNGSAEYSLFNPSVADFAQARLGASGLWAHYYLAMRTLKSLIQLEKMRNQPFMGKTQFRAIVDTLAASETRREGLLDGYSLRIARLVVEDVEWKHKYPELVLLWLRTPDVDVVEWQPSDYLRLFNGCSDLVDLDTLADFSRELPEILKFAPLPLDEPELVKTALEMLQSVHEYAAEKKLREHVIEDWAETVAETVRSSDALADFFDEEEADAALGRLQDTIGDWLLESGVELEPDELERLCDKVDVEQAIYRNRERADHDDEDSGFRGGGGYDGDVAAVDDLFDRSGR